MVTTRNVRRRYATALALALDLGTLTSRPVRQSRAGSVTLVGGGPGDPELITVRGRRVVSEAEVIVVDRLAPRELLADLPDDVEIIDCGKQAHRHNLSQSQINEILVQRALAGRRVVRLKGGEPSSSVVGRRRCGRAWRRAYRSR